MLATGATRDTWPKTTPTSGTVSTIAPREADTEALTHCHALPATFFHPRRIRSSKHLVSPR